MPARRTLRLVLALLAAAVSRPAAAADTLLLHGHVFTGRSGWAEAIAVSGGRIEAVGPDAAIEALRSGTTQVIDLEGRTVLPGIIDAHLHMLFGALELHGLNLSTPGSSLTPDDADAFVAKVSEFARSHADDEVIFGRADFNVMEPLGPDHTLLDRAVPDRPVSIHNTSEHALLLNAAALKLAGVTRAPLPDAAMEKGVVRDAFGNPTGMMLEAAMGVEHALVEHVPREKRLAILEAAATYLNSLGITGVVNATGNLEEVGLYGELRDRGRLTVRTRTAFGSIAEPHRLTPRFLADLETARRRYSDSWVSANLVKFFADGDTGSYPPLVYTADDYRRLVIELDRRGFQLMTHALRTDTVAMVLDAYEAASKANGPRDRRLRLEHGNIIDDADIGRLKRLDIIASMQPGFCCSENGLNWDPRRTEATDRWRSFKDRGALLAFGSDWPCLFPPDPMMGIRAAATRQVWHSAATASILGQPLDGAGQGGAIAAQTVYTPGERLSVEEAVEAYTAGSAYATFQEKELGTLERGKLADLIVLSQDIFSVPPETLSGTRVLLTMVGGKVVYQAPPARH
jgi:hypothetical protein